jgi:nucleotide-binding universal stress UspA family protein
MPGSVQEQASAMVVAFDARRGGEDATTLAALLATERQRILPTMVVPMPPGEIGDPPLRPSPEAKTWQAIGADLARQGREALERTALPLLGGFDVEPILLIDDSAARALTGLCERESAGMLVLGSTHRGRLGRLAPGATVDRMLSGSPCPVALAPRGLTEADPRPLGRIGVGFDGSATSAQALRFAAELALAHDAALEVIGVVDLRSHAESRVGGEALDALAGQGLHDRRGEAIREAADVELQQLGTGLRSRVEVVHGDPAAELLARTASLDLLVVGSRGYGPLRRVLLGSVSSELIRASECPMIVTHRA